MSEKQNFHEILVDFPHLFPEMAQRMLGRAGLIGGVHEYQFILRTLTEEDYRKGYRTPQVIEIKDPSSDRPGAVIDVDSLHDWPF